MGLTHEQKTIRRSGIGGSDIGAVCGLSKWRSPIDVYLDKIGKGGPYEETPATQWGHRLEPVIASAYAEKHGAVLVGPFDPIRTDVAPWHIMTIDRLQVADGFVCSGNPDVLPPREHTLRLIEIKSASWQGAAHGFGAAGTDALPLTYLAQVAWYLAGLKIQHATVAALINTNDYREYVVERDPELEGYLLERGATFWRQVETRQAPEPDGSESFRRYLQNRFRRTTELIVASSPDVDAVAGQLRAAKLLHRELKKRTDLLEQQLQLAIGANDGIDTEHGKLTYRFDKRGRTNWKAVAAHMAKAFDQDLDALAQAHAHDRPRRFLSPRAWLTDELPSALNNLLPGDTDNE